MRSLRFEEAGGDPDLQLGREFLHCEHRRVFGNWPCIGEKALVFDPAEIRAFEQLGRKHHLSALCGPFAPELAHCADVRRSVVREAELQRSDRDLAHAGTCCEMQWKLPPPVRMWSARRPIAMRSGNSAWSTSTAARSFGAPYCGTTTEALPI